MKTAYLVILCFCLSCNLSDAGPIQPTLDASKDIKAKSDQDNIEDEEDGVGTSALLASEFTPEDGAANVARNTKISFAVNKELDQSTVTLESFVLKNQSGEIVDATNSFSSELNTVVLVPSSPLSLLEVYTASITDEITDLDGNPIEAHTWSFTIRDGVWQTPESLQSEEGWAQRPRVATDSRENAAVIWSQDFSNTNTIFVSRFETQSGWTEQVSIGDNSTDAFLPNLNYDSNGQLVAVWEQRELAGDSRAPNLPWSNRFTTSWAGPTPLGPDGLQSSRIQLANDGLGNTSAIWLAHRGTSVAIVIRRLENDEWKIAFDLARLPFGVADLFLGIGGKGNGFAGWTQDGEIKIKSSSTAFQWGNDEEQIIDSGSPQITMNKKGNAVLVWRTLTPDGIDLWARQFIEDAWGEPMNIIKNNGGTSADKPRVDMNENGDSSVIWTQDQTLFASQLNANNWSAPELLDTSDQSKNWKIKLDHLGNGIAVWESVPDVKVKRFTKKEGWNETMTIEDAARPDLAITSSGNAFLVWETRVGLEPTSIKSIRFE